MNSNERLFLERKKYYGDLIVSYVDTILSSKELVQDDFEITLSVYREGEFDFLYKEPSRSYSLVAGTYSLVATVAAAKKYGSLYMVPPAILTASFASYYFYRRHRKYKNEHLIMELVKSLKSLQSLNNKIHKYLLERKTHSTKCSSIVFKPYSDSLNCFMKKFSKQQLAFQEKMISDICDLAEYCVDLREDCELIKQLKQSSATKVFEGIENSVKYTKFIKDVQQHLNSKLLSYFSIICCSEESTLTTKMLDKFLNNKIPSIVVSINTHHNNISGLFNSLKRAVTKISDFEPEPKLTMKVGYFTERLKESLQASENNLCFVLEKLRNIVDLLERSDNNVDSKIIRESLTLLRKQTADTYEAINILCQVHGVVSASLEIGEDKGIDPKFSEKYEAKPEVNLKTIEIPTDPKVLVVDRERYNLYVTGVDEVELPQPIHEEISSASMTRPLIKELTQNLKQHEFYTSAKQRWKAVSDEDTSDGSPEHESSDSEEPVTVRENIISPKKTKTKSKTKGTTKEASTANLLEVPGTSKTDQQEEDVTSQSEKDNPKIDTLTRVVENEEQEQWNPILHEIKAHAPDTQLPEETFGEVEEDE